MTTDYRDKVPGTPQRWFIPNHNRDRNDFAWFWDGTYVWATFKDPGISATFDVGVPLAAMTHGPTAWTEGPEPAWYQATRWLAVSEGL